MDYLWKPIGLQDPAYPLYSHPMPKDYDLLQGHQENEDFPEHIHFLDKAIPYPWLKHISPLEFWRRAQMLGLKAGL